MRSRLRTNVKKQTIHILIFIISIVIILAAFGTNLLVGFSVGLNMLRGSDKVEITQQEVNYVAPPVLDPLPAATKVNSVNISGSAITSDDVEINLFINGEPIDKVKPNKDGTFSFQNIELKKGENEIKSRSTTTTGKQSDFSEDVKIKYLDKNPTLEISVPSDGQTFRKDQGQIRISGKTDPGAKVTVNDFWTITNDNGDFYYTYTLKDGENSLMFISTDEAGNTTTKQINIKTE